MAQAIQKLSLLIDASASPWTAFLAIVLASLILEDAAAVLAGMAAADGRVSVAVALGSLFVGIAIGDIALYALGRFAARHPAARRWVALDRVQEVRGWIDDKLIATVIATRFLPGARLPTYTACGFLGLSFPRFVVAVLLGVFAWTTVLFTIFLGAGSLIMAHLGPWRWPAGIAVAAVVMLVGHWFSRRRALSRKERDQSR
jgi:membrane protein DedA with SNARE-associated domain